MGAVGGEISGRLPLELDACTHLGRGGAAGENPERPWCLSDRDSPYSAGRCSVLRDDGEVPGGAPRPASSSILSISHLGSPFPALSPEWSATLLSQGGAGVPAGPPGSPRTPLEGHEL